MNKFFTFFLSCCTIFLLAGCPKPGSGTNPGPGPGGTCGGLLGATCPADQYCQYDINANCGRGDMTGICTPQRRKCTQEYLPVCGCDGKTYGNSCMAAESGMSVDYQGECAK